MDGMIYLDCIGIRFLAADPHAISALRHQRAGERRLFPDSGFRHSELGSGRVCGDRRDVIVTSCCHYNISEAEAIELSHRKPACPGAVCSTQSSNSIGC